MKLHVESLGQGPDLVFLHGWAMHGAVWYSVAHRLAERFRVHLVDLPGYGWSADCGAMSLDATVSALSQTFPAPVTVCGWSLGGLVALRWAMREPDQVTRLILVAASPCFVRRDDWLPAMDAAVLTQFAAALARDYAGTLQKFLALQVLHSVDAKVQLQTLLQRLFDRGQPAAAVLASGLETLATSDLRESVQHIRQPSLLIYGERDALVPVAAGAWLSENLSSNRFERVAGAAHIPFLSHPTAFVDALLEFAR